MSEKLEKNSMEEEEDEKKPRIGDLMGGFNYKIAKKWEDSLLEYKSGLNAETMKGEEAKKLNDELISM